MHAQAMQPSQCPCERNWIALPQLSLYVAVDHAWPLCGMHTGKQAGCQSMTFERGQNVRFGRSVVAA